MYLLFGITAVLMFVMVTAKIGVKDRSWGLFFALTAIYSCMVFSQLQVLKLTKTVVDTQESQRVLLEKLVEIQQTDNKLD